MGSIFDVYTIIVLVRDREFKRPHYILLLGAVITDLACNSFFIPIEAIQSHHLISFYVPWGNKLFCVVENYIFAIFFNSSVICQALIAFNRILAVFTPVFYQRKATVKVAFIGWLTFGIGLPAVYHAFALAFRWITYDIDELAGDCQAKDSSQVARGFRLAINVYMPLAFSLCSYMSISLKFVSTKSVEKRSSILKRAKGSLAMFVSTIFYCVCLLPLWWVSRLHLWLFLWMKFLFRSSYAMNPVSDYFPVIFLVLL